MTKDAHYERSSQHSSEDLTRGRNGQRPKHLKFFLLVFLRIKQVVNNLGSLWGPNSKYRLEKGTFSIIGGVPFSLFLALFGGILT